MLSDAMAGHAKRKRERAAAAAEAEATAAAGAGSASGTAPKVVPIGWEELLARAEASLDEAGMEKVVKRKAVAEKIRRRMAERGQKEFVDVEAMKRALCAYWADATGGGPMRGWRRVFAESGAKTGDFLGGATDRFPDLNTAFRYIQGLIGNMAREDAAETVAIAQAGQRRLLTEDGCELNQRAVELSLKATMRDVYGDGDGGGTSDAKKGISYNFPNMTVNWIVAPGELVRRDGGRLEADAGVKVGIGAGAGAGARPEVEVIDV